MEFIFCGANGQHTELHTHDRFKAIIRKRPQMALDRMRVGSESQVIYFMDAHVADRPVTIEFKCNERPFVAGIWSTFNASGSMNISLPIRKSIIHCTMLACKSIKSFLCISNGASAEFQTNGTIREPLESSRSFIKYVRL